MPDSTLTNLAEATSVAAGDLIYAVVGGNARKVQAGNFRLHAQQVLDSADPSAAAQVDFALPSGWKQYEVSGYLVPATDGDPLLFRFSNDGGATFRNGASDYTYASHKLDDGGATNDDASAGASEIDPLGITSVGRAAGEHVAFRFRIYAARESGLFTLIRGEMVLVQGNGELAVRWFGGRVATAEVNDAIRLFFSAGNIESGHAVLIGIKGS